MRPSSPRASLLLCAAALLHACSDEAAPPPGARTSPAPRDEGGADGGSVQPPSPRPAGAPHLPEADESVTLPFGGPAVERMITIDAAPSALDLVFDVDTTASMTGEIDELQRSLGTVVAPGLLERVDDVSFAVARFEDFPLPPFGSSGDGGLFRPDEPYRLLMPVTSDLAQVTSALANLDRPLGDGGDIEESGAEALWQIARGDGFHLRGEQLIEPYSGDEQPGGGSVPGVGFRESTLRAVVHVTDAPSHVPADYKGEVSGVHDLDDAAGALREAKVKALSILSNACTDPDTSDGCDAERYATAREQLVSLAVATSALGAPEDGSCPYGVEGRPIEPQGEHCPLVFEVAASGEGLSEALVGAVAALVEGTRFQVVSAQAAENPIGFVSAVVPVASDGGPVSADRLPEDDPDGKLDSFVDVATDQALTFAITLRNRVVPSRDFEQRFRVVIEVQGDGVVLARRTLRVVVPAAPSLLPDASLLADDDAGG